MRILRLDCRVTVGSLVLVCLSASGFSPFPVRSAGRSGKVPGNEQTGQQADVCESKMLDFVSTGEQGQTFKFKCLKDSTLSPVADAKETKTQNSPDPLQKVNVFDPAKPEEPCKTQEMTLDQLVPGSKLAATNGVANGVADSAEASTLTYTLTLGAAPEQERHLCYICNAPTTSGGELQSRSSGQQDCTIHVTVPAKKESDGSQQPDTNPDQQPGQNPDGQTDPKPDKPSDSGSSSLSVSGWLMLCVAGSVLGLMVHL